jgi:exonuclease SbcC
MRPLRLTMQAFGPFAGREIVDFRDATSAGLFGVYGPTGAGKSTIFSAMTFALFGEAAKEEQETVSLRSDYASADLPTEVELIFEIADRRYVIRRRPDQLRPKLRGGGSTRMAHEAWLFDATGMSLDGITPEQSGKVVAERKAGAVGDAVEGVLGYGAQQFRQIVLLPQGRFERFLAAKTEARLAILRELFDVSLYRGLAEKTKKDATEIERQVREARAVCARRLAAEAFESGETLKQGVEETQALARQQGERVNHCNQAAANAGQAVSSAEQIEQKFLDHEAAQVTLASLAGQEGEFREIDERNRKVRRVEAVLENERHNHEAEQEFRQATAGVAAATELASAAGLAKATAAARLAEETGRESDRVGLRAEIQQLDLHQKVLAGTAALATHAEQAKDRLKKAAADITVGEAALNRLSTALAASEQALDKARKNGLLRATLDAELAKLQAEENATRAVELKERELAEANTALARASAKLDRAGEVAETAQQQFNEAERRLAAVQALHLAAKLSPGEACPVCGALDHPTPATGRIENAGLDEAFRKAKEGSEKANKARDLAASEHGLAAAKRTVLEGTLADMARPLRPASIVREAIGSTKAQLQALGVPEAVSQAELKVSQVREQHEKARATLDAIQTAKSAAETGAAESSARLQQALSLVPEGFRQMAALSNASEHAGQKLTASEAALRQAETLERKTREAALSASKDLESATTRLTKARERLEASTKRFADRLAEHGLSREEFSTLKTMVATVRESEEQVSEFQRQLDVSKAGAAATGMAVENAVRPDLAALRQALDAANQLARAATDESARTAARLEHLRKLHEELTASLEAFSKLEEDSNALRTLAQLFNAENELRVDLETFAIGAMFDQVIDAANQRLGPMTAGRYTLEREVVASGGRSRRGLGIQVQDVFTGKARATSTLSGGETFIAALSLALGLSDVVERTNGRVRLDTIFIDEGFGSLDAENEAGTLDQVLQVLTNLVSEHRSVGLISHVPLVQEAVPNGFYVRKGMQGSHVESRGLL